ncbi:hypothetical protein RB623_29155 [Mesorhizobium sp. LHD-90]|uniref:hypothetical protein n=1 Tax=Mesorhizobium sp. LHD-90 TaxID=3071414 RepID=UPI0027E0C201|nr:hypothetical protein [Mesorhizobium sp. LHD-90]MDQ6438141.1 hypothetical protein [Mesorhizobium sp. LHD-90]
MAHSDHISHTLTFDDAVQVWKLRRQGWFQHRIAARFDVNPGRISDVLKERKHPGSRAVAERDGGHHG